MGHPFDSVPNTGCEEQRRLLHTEPLVHVARGFQSVRAVMLKDLPYFLQRQSRDFVAPVTLASSADQSSQLGIYRVR